MKTLLVIIILLLIGILGNTADAMDFKKQTLESGTVVIWAQGDIETGDHKKLEALLKSSKNKKVFVLLNSDGGYVDEGLLMGSAIRKHGANTGIDTPYINQKAICASSCALVFYGGHDRVMTSNSALGVHQMRTESTNARLTEESAQFWTSLVYQYADEVNMPRELVHIMFRTPPKDMFFVSPKEANRIGARAVK